MMKSVVLSLTAASIALTACEGGGTGSYTSGAGRAVMGGECASNDPSQLCIGLKYVVYKDSSGNAVTNERDAVDNLDGINRIWKQCGIAFQIEKYEEVNPAEKGLPFGGSAAESQTSATRQAYAEDDTFLVVTTGAWGVTKNAWTASPGDGPYGAVMEGSISRGYSEIYAHELGHYLGLDHVSDSSDLMTPIIAHSSTNLDAGQCAQTRKIATEFWSKMLRS
jgi:hypothetical protein